MSVETIEVNNRILIKDSLSFFEFKAESRFILTITDKASVWKNDLVIGEHMFGEMIICPYVFENSDDHVSVLENVKDILKQRMKYPGVKENPEIEKIARTWIVPNKVHLGPNANIFFGENELNILEGLTPIFTELNNSTSKIHYLKIELEKGIERQLIYKFLDNGFRPSFILVKWSYDVDAHVSTSSCIGHMISSGYCLLGFNNDYSLYMFNNQVLYDIISMKTITTKNAIMEEILQQVSNSLETK
jgi:hypothetical protein